LAGQRLDGRADNDIVAIAIGELADRPGEYLVVLDDALHAALYGDTPEWNNAVQRLERDWMMPLLQALIE